MARKPAPKATPLNVDACRIEAAPARGDGWRPNCADKRYEYERDGEFLSDIASGPVSQRHPSGRWPANLVLDEVAAEMLGDSSRFLYTAKASRRERNAGLEGMPERSVGAHIERTDAHSHKNGMNTAPAQNAHPTVKPLSLMRWLIRLVTPPGGIVLDPFAGSGSTGCAAALEGFEFIGIEREAEYVEIVERRITHWRTQARQPELIGGVA